jgi:hypothetical protein
VEVPVGKGEGTGTERNWHVARGLHVSIARELLLYKESLVYYIMVWSAGSGPGC